MALVNNGARVMIPSKQLPTGYTKPTVTTFDDEEYEFTHTVEVAKASVDEADPKATVAAIVTAVEAAAEALVTEDYLTDGVDTTMYSDILGISNNQKLSTEFYTNVAAKYLVTVKTYVKVEPTPGP